MRFPNLPSSEITPEGVYLDRRRFLTAAGLIGAGLVGTGSLQALAPSGHQAQPKPLGKPYGLQPGDTPTSWEDVTGYNNFYEFGTGKEDPKENAQGFRTKPWTVRVDGLVEKPGNYALEDFLKPSVVEDRIYRMRCVEGDPVAGDHARRCPQAREADRQGGLRRVHDVDGSRADAGAALSGPRVALHRGAPPR
jgi:sulfoxide reductase catalytic subunit YedY